MQSLDRKEYFHQQIIAIQIVVVSNLTANNSAYIRISPEDKLFTPKRKKIYKIPRRNTHIEELKSPTKSWIAVIGSGRWLP